MSITGTGASRKNTVVRMSSSSSSSKQIFAPFFSKTGELVTKYTHSIMESIKDFKLNLESLHKSLIWLNGKASVVKEQIKSLDGSGQKKRKREIEDWLRRVVAIENEVIQLGTRAEAESEGFIKSMIDGGKVTQLSEEVVKLVDQSRGFDGLLHGARGTGVELLITGIIGGAFDENFKEICKLLDTREVSSIGIYGMGGVGKTLLAKCINNRLLKQSLVSVFWINVSQELTIMSLQDKIARFLGVNFWNEGDEDIRAALLHGALSQTRNSVLILDDLWDNIDLSKVGCPVSMECCRLVITTRSLEVCRQMCCQRVIAVKTLDTDAASMLFFKTFAMGERIVLEPPALQVAASMTKMCGGLPLGIITMAGRMRGVTSIPSWRTALADMMESPAMQDGVFRSLKYSFDRLNNQSQGSEFNLIQRCFLYCSVYPQDHLPFGDDLVERFISEGLVDGRKSRRAQVNQGHCILDKLLKVGLLETDSDNCLRMHNLMKGMALKISGGKYMFREYDYSLKEIPDEEEWTLDLEKVFLMHSDMTMVPDGMSPNCPRLSTLVLQDNRLSSIPDAFFSRMKRLKSLDLCRTHITMLPDLLSNLTNLESLLLEGCSKLETVPYLGKLKALRELNLSDTAIKEVPHGLQELLNLKFLSMNGSELEMLPTGLLLKLGHLQVLKLPIQVQIPTEEIVNLKEVEQLYGRLNALRAFNSFIKSLKHDTIYQVQVGSLYHPEGGEAFLDLGRRVYLNNCNLKDEKVLGRDMEVLTIRECEGLSKSLLDAFLPSSYPKSLRILTVQRCEGIECLLTSSRDSSSQFSTLEHLELEELDDFKGLRGETVGAAPAQSGFPSLKRLTVGNCNGMRKLGLPFLGAPNLEQITIRKCGVVEEIFEDDGLGCLAHHKLRVLNLEELPRLKRLRNAKMVCNSMLHISIFRCPRMKILPLHFEDVTLSTLKIEVEREWWESLDWENPTLPLLLKPLLRFH